MRILTVMIDVSTPITIKEIRRRPTNRILRTSGLNPDPSSPLVITGEIPIDVSVRIIRQPDQ